MYHVGGAGFRALGVQGLGNVGLRAPGVSVFRESRELRI